jgi:hypothetical protein
MTLPKPFKVTLPFLLHAACICFLLSRHCHAQVTTSGTITVGTVPYLTGPSAIGSTSLYYDSSTGHLGIGWFPNFAVDANGDFNTSGVLRYNGSPVLISPGGGNLGVGQTAFASNTTGQYSTAIGYGSLYSNTSGGDNAALGWNSLYNNTIGVGNTAVGTYSLVANINGSLNVGLGTAALADNVSGNMNTANGFGSLESVTTGGSNTGLGAYSLQSLTTGSTNNVLGANALSGLETGTDNVALGDGAGSDAGNGSGGTTPNAAGTQNVYLGASSISLASGDTNEIVIGALAMGNGSNSVTLGNQNVTSTTLRGDVHMTGSGPTSSLPKLVFGDGTYLTTAPTGSGSSGSVGTVTSGVWNGSPIAAAYLPPDVDYLDQAQSITGQKSFTQPVGFGTTAPGSLLTVANPAADGQGTFTQGILFADSVNGSATPWGHAAIYTVGSTGYNGSLVFATDGDGVQNTNPTEKMRITASGQVGIDTTTPNSAAKLEVNGPIYLTAGSGAYIEFPDGSPQATAWNGVLTGGDYAESVNVSGNRDAYEPGDVLVIDPTSEGNFLKSSAPYSTAVTGIYSTKPGVVGRRQVTAKDHMKEEVPMAMTGIVPTKVSAENGPIKPGDLLVTSSKPGYAMKGTDRTQMLGAVIGKAIGHLDSGLGTIEVVVTLQ